MFPVAALLSRRSPRPRCCRWRSPCRPSPSRSSRWSRPAMAEAAPAATRTCWCSISARRSTAAAPRPTPKGHIPGAVHSDYDKAGWRVTRNGVPFMLPTVAELEKLIGETGIDEDSHVVVVPAGVQRHRFRLGGAHLLDAEGRGPSGGVDPRRRLRRLAGGRAYPVESGASKPSPKIFTATLDKSLFAMRARSRRSNADGGATLVDARPASFFAGKEKAPASQGLRPHSGRDQSRQRDVLRSRDQPAAAAGRACRDRRGAVPAGPGGRLLQHRTLGRDRLVRAVGGARPQGREAL